MPSLQIATFHADVTPPIGHPLCAGWLPPAIALTDRLAAQGVVLLGGGQPVVLCAIDWCEISNRSHIAFREKLARAASTTADRVAVQTMHPHCTPWPDEGAQRLIDAAPKTRAGEAVPASPGAQGEAQVSPLRDMMDPAWCNGAIDRIAAAVAAAVKQARPLTHLGLGSAKVREVASNRRIMGPDGKVKAVRWTATKDPAVRAEPEGLIDPWLKTISFWSGEQKVAVLHYYAVHDTSYDKDSKITCDFTGLARNRRAAEDVPHVYFTACAGNITAGKYNDGAPENRAVLTQKIYDAMLESERSVEKIACDRLEWKTVPVQLPPLESDVRALTATLNNTGQAGGVRSRAALKLAYLERYAEPIPFTRLRLADRVDILHLPGEPFIEYQLQAQQARPDHFVAVAGYGDCGPGYVCLERSYAEGGYEPTDSFVAPQSERLVREAISELMR